MKTCSSCKQSKSESEFYSKGSGLHSRCKSCSALYAKKHYKANCDKYKARARSNNKVYQKRNVDYVRDLKSKVGCTYCNESEPVALDFHHISEDKEHNIAQLARSSVSIKRLDEEINKCIVVCANCHRKLHAGLI